MKKSRKLSVKHLFFSLGLFSLGAFAFHSVEAAPAVLDPSQIQLNSLSLDQLQQAAQAGDPDAQYALGYMYYYGKNVPQNTPVALDWIKRAAVQGQAQAVKALSLLGQAQSTASVPPATVNIAANNQPTADYNAAPKNQPLTVAPVANNVNAAKQNPPAAPAVTTAAVDDNSALPTEPTKPVKKMKAAEVAVAGSGLASSAALQKAPASYYTIQILASSRENDLQQYIRRHKLEGKAAYYRSNSAGKEWYVLVYGLYKNRGEAQLAIAKLPAELRSGKPWVKSVSSVQSTMAG